ncbi:hypothetical protein [Synechococcus sp. A15-60]|uniref:hypothetical protein n=1 Tax=Synechococcus sp. A15-60 TaxID=1050655 RepID=UPI002104AF64|nr:hypothetical protein [Synechococcus sp. A15-60]
MDLTSPQRVIDPTTYVIRFSDADHGVWDGSGLAFAPGGQATYDISRSCYNAGGGCWQFEGAGGQSSLRLDLARGRFGHEINLFRGRSRSMLVLLWEPHDDAWRLQAVGAVAFRCRDAADLEPERPTCGTPEALLEPLRGWSGYAESLRPQPGVMARASDPQSVVFEPDQLLRHDCSAVMPDGLAFSVPECLPDAAFTLEIGARLGADRFQHVSIRFDADGRLLRWDRSSFQPASVS